jgi:ABC-type polar amino acid transport system ATPase subunit
MIRVETLHKRIGPHEILRDVTFVVSRGEVAVFIGGSGGGKSTLLRCLNGLETFDSGRVQVGDVSLLADGVSAPRGDLLQRLRRRVGMVFQQFNLFPHMTVLENVMAGPRFALGQSTEAAAPSARALLARVGMEAFADRRPATLSGGQQQRVAIARTLAMQPEVILFDEPTSALDPRMTAEVLSVMADLAAAGQTMIVVSHAMSFVRKSATRVHVLDEGRIVESGPPAQIFTDAQHPATRSFLADVGK